MVGMHAASYRAGQQLAEVIVHGVVAEIEHRAEDAIHAACRFIRRRAAVAAGRVFAVEPAIRLNLAHAVRARIQIAKFVEAALIWIGRRNRRDAGGVAVGVNQLESYAADALLGNVVEQAVIAAIVIDPTGERGQRNLGGMGDRAGRAIRIVVRGRIAVVVQAKRKTRRVCGRGKLVVERVPICACEREIDVSPRGELADNERPLKLGAFHQRVHVDVLAIDILRFVGVDRKYEFLAGVETAEIEHDLRAAVDDGHAVNRKPVGAVDG